MTKHLSSIMTFALVLFGTVWLLKQEPRVSVPLPPSTTMEASMNERISYQSSTPTVKPTNKPLGTFLHPRIKYPSPEKIRSFADESLIEAYSIYFSLIGPTKEKYPYSRSGFDTPFNAELAQKTILGADYHKSGKDLQREFEGVVNAITHLTHCESIEARVARERLSEELVNRIHVSKDVRLVALHRADLVDLVENLQESDRPWLLRLEGMARDARTRGILRRGIEKMEGRS